MTAKIVSMRRSEEAVNGAGGVERQHQGESVAALHAKIDRLAAAVEKLSAAQQAQSELFDELMPIGALAVKKLSATIDEVRAEAEALKPAGVMGLWRATSDEDVRRGLAIAVETVRRLGAAARPDGARLATNAGALTKAAGVRHAAAKAGGSGAAHGAGAGAAHGAGAAVAEPSKRDKLAAALAPSRMRTQTTVALSDAQTAKTVPQGQPVTRNGVTHATAPTAAGSSGAGLEGIRLNEEGFLADARAWSPAVAIRIAASLGVGELTEAHWKLVNYAREQFIESGASPNVRKITVGTGVSTREMYGLFPVKPGITVAKIAGIPKPVGCV